MASNETIIVAMHSTSLVKVSLASAPNSKFRKMVRPFRTLPNTPSKEVY